MDFNFVRNPQLRDGFASIFDQAQVGKGKNLFVDTVNGLAGNDGLSWGTACLTMGAALLKAASRDTIYFVGKIIEQVTAPLGVYGVRIVGADTSPRHDLAASWMGTGLTASKALLELREQGWSLENILFQSFTTGPAVKLSRGEDATYPDPSHASFINCRFTGADGIWDAGGCYGIKFINCKFHDLTGTAIKAVAGPNGGIAHATQWLLEDVQFLNNAVGIVHDFKWCVLKRVMFGANTVTINLTGGEAPNFLLECMFDEANATFTNTAGYYGLTGDVWNVYLTDQVRNTIPTVA